MKALFTGFQMLYRLSQDSKVFLSFRNSAELSKLSMPITLRPRASFVMNSTACCEPGGGVGGCVQLLGAQQLHH